MLRYLHFFKNTVKPALTRLGKRIGTHVLRAGVGVAGDMVNRKISSRGEVKDIFKTHAKNQMKAFKRKLLVDDDDNDEERQMGGQLKRRKKPAQKSVNKRRMSAKKSTKKSTSQRRVHKQKRKRVINKKSKQKQKQSW